MESMGSRLDPNFDMTGSITFSVGPRDVQAGRYPVDFSDESLQTTAERIQPNVVITWQWFDHEESFIHEGVPGATIPAIIEKVGSYNIIMATATNWREIDTVVRWALWTHASSDPGVPQCVVIPSFSNVPGSTLTVTERASLLRNRLSYLVTRSHVVLADMTTEEPARSQYREGWEGGTSAGERCAFCSVS